MENNLTEQKSPLSSFTSKQGEEYSINFTFDPEISAEFDMWQSRESGGLDWDLEKFITQSKCVFKESKTSRYSIVQDDTGTPVTGAGVHITKNIDYGVIAEIQAVYTKPDQRRKGLSYKNFENVIEYAKQHQARMVQLCVHQKNPGARALYLKLGFTVPLSYYMFDYCILKWDEEKFIEKQEIFGRNVNHYIDNIGGSDDHDDGDDFQEKMGNFKIVWMDNKSEFPDLMKRFMNTNDHFVNILGSHHVESENLKERIFNIFEEIQENKDHRSHELGLIMNEKDDFMGVVYAMKVYHFTFGRGLLKIQNLYVQENFMEKIWEILLLKVLKDFNDYHLQSIKFGFLALLFSNECKLKNQIVKILSSLGFGDSHYETLRLVL